eukprot:gene19592-biopygen977
MSKAYAQKEAANMCSPPRLRASKPSLLAHGPRPELWFMGTVHGHNHGQNHGQLQSRAITGTLHGQSRAHFTGTNTGTITARCRSRATLSNHGKPG